MFVEIFVEIFSFPQIQRFIRGGSLQQPQSGAVFSERYKKRKQQYKKQQYKKTTQKQQHKKEGMSQENYPTQPTERFESKSLVERFYRQPRIGEDQVNSATQSKSETTHRINSYIRTTYESSCGPLPRAEPFCLPTACPGCSEAILSRQNAASCDSDRVCSV